MDNLDEAGLKLDNATQRIFNIATGALALSITFRSSIAPEDAICKWMLSLAWIALAAVPISYILLNMLEAAQSICWHKLDVQGKENEKEGEPLEPLQGVPQKIQDYANQSALCWKIMLISFLVGIVCLLSFGIINNGV